VREANGSSPANDDGAAPAFAGAEGDVHVRDLPGKGCVFSVELPRPSA
jgi:hypothetical protein